MSPYLVQRPSGIEAMKSRGRWGQGWLAEEGVETGLGRPSVTAIVVTLFPIGAVAGLTVMVGIAKVPPRWGLGRDRGGPDRVGHLLLALADNSQLTDLPPRSNAFRTQTPEAGW